MNAVREIYDDLPESIIIPSNLRHKKAEVIIIALDDRPEIHKNDISKLYGSIPDFPERFVVNDFDIREPL